ncbi:MAG: hypothetical protein RBS07_07660 [Lentimicrobium sp.]|nr:hypothetical protein [Lentimicrobium sp.]
MERIVIRHTGRVYESLNGWPTDGDGAIKNDAFRVQVPASLGDKQARFDSAHPR